MESTITVASLWSGLLKVVLNGTLEDFASVLIISRCKPYNAGLYINNRLAYVSIQRPFVTSDMSVKMLLCCFGVSLEDTTLEDFASVLIISRCKPYNAGLYINIGIISRCKPYNAGLYINNRLAYVSIQRPFVTSDMSV